MHFHNYQHILIVSLSFFQVSVISGWRDLGDTGRCSRLVFISNAVSRRGTGACGRGAQWLLSGALWAFVLIDSSAGVAVDAVDGGMAPPAVNQNYQRTRTTHKSRTLLHCVGLKSALRGMAEFICFLKNSPLDNDIKQSLRITPRREGGGGRGGGRAGGREGGCDRVLL